MVDGQLPSARKPSRSLILLLILILVLALTLVSASYTLLNPPAPEGVPAEEANQSTPQPVTPAPGSGITAIPAAAASMTPTPTATPDSESPDLPSVMVLAQTDVPASAFSTVKAALEDELASARLPALLPVVELAPAPEGETASAAYEQVCQSLNAAVLIVLSAGSDGVNASIYGACNPPPLVQVEVPPTLWPVLAPGDLTLLVGDARFVAGLVIALLETRAGQPEAALLRLESLESSREGIPFADHEQAALGFARGVALAQEGQLSAALEEIGQVVVQEPGFAAGQIVYGNLWLAAGDSLSAQAAYNAALEAQPSLQAAVYNRALAYLALSNGGAALADAEWLAAYNPASWSANLRGYVYYRRQDYQEALEDFDLAATYLPDDPTVMFNQALARSHLGDYGAALITLDMLVEQYPEDPVYWYYFGATFEAAGIPARSEQAYSEALVLLPTYVEAFIARGKLRLAQEDYAGASADASQALEIAPESGAAYALKGDVLLEQDVYAEAVTAYNDALARGYTSAGVYASRGIAQHNLGNVHAAYQDYLRALDLGYDGPALYLRLGFAALDSGDPEQALGAFQSAFSSGDRTAELRAGLAVAYEALARPDEAEQHYQRAVDLFPDYADPVFLAGRPMWSGYSIALAEAILSRLAAGSETPGP
jgi:tetratricopeptide (TPR) repeat protein